MQRIALISDRYYCNAVYHSCYYQHGKTALMWAAAEGHLEVVIKSTELGVDLAVTDLVSNVQIQSLAVAAVMLHSLTFYLLVDQLDS